MATKRDCAERSSHESCKDGSGDRAAEIFVDLGKEPGEWNGVVACKGPPRSADSEEGSNEAGGKGQEDDEEEAECCSVAACGLGVDFREGKGAVAV
jgi:hypothetical protein